MTRNHSANSAATGEASTVHDVLAVARYEIFRYGLAQLLRSRLPGLTVDVAEDAAAARQRASEKRYDLIIVDGDLPNGEAWSLLRVTSSWQSIANTMLLLGHDCPECRVEAQRCGVQYVAAKSDSVETVVDCVERALSA